MAKIRKLVQNNEDLYPITHETAVFDNNGVNIGTKIENIENDMINLVDIDEIEDIENNYVNPEMFGAKGDGTTDDTEAFTRLFNSGKSIRCTKGKVYYFNGIINARNITGNTLFDGNYATFKNFKLEISLKDDQYDWRYAYSPNILEIINCDFNMSLDEKELYYTPVIISGMNVRMRNINLYDRLVLLAYPERYIDRLHLDNVLKVYTNSSPEDSYNYNAIMRITTDGDLIEMSEQESCGGDSWVFNSCNEFYTTNIYTEPETCYVKRYNLITTNKNSCSFNDCIQSNVQISKQSIVEFNNCHWENSYTYFNESSESNTSITYNNCYFYGNVIPDVKRFMTFIGCFFRFGYGEKFKYLHGKSMLKNSNIINCRFGDYSGPISSSEDLLIDIGCNYKGDDLEEYRKDEINILEGESTNGSFVGETKITFYAKRIEANYYYIKSTNTITLDGTNIIRLLSTCNGPSFYEFYIENDGVIYKGSTKTNDSVHEIEIHVFNNYFRAYVTYRDEKLHKCYPSSDTMEIVESIPEIIECSTLYRISKGLCIDTSDNPVSNIPRFAVLTNTGIEPGNMW